jgi:hypothetical protein
MFKITEKTYWMLYCLLIIYLTLPLFNSLSYHDMQLIKLSNTDLKIHSANFKISRKFDTYSTLDFQT